MWLFKAARARGQAFPFMIRRLEERGCSILDLAYPNGVGFEERMRESVAREAKELEEERRRGRLGRRGNRDDIKLCCGVVQSIFALRATSPKVFASLHQTS